MNFFVIGFLIMQAARLACGTCVLASDFGFILDCNFKKSGLFRVRNLGGLKAHFGLGFSLGDELGFAESLGNLEGGRRRAISYKNGAPPELVGVLPSTQQEARTSQQALPEKRISSRSTGPLPYNVQLLQQAIQRQAAATAPQQPLMTEARPLPLGVPAFRPIPKKPADNEAVQTPLGAQRRIAVDTPQPRVSLNNKLVDSHAKPHSNRTFHTDNAVVSQPQAVPVFQAMPDSISRIANVGKTTATKVAKHPNYLQFEEPKFDLKDVTVEELAAAANVSVETIKHAIYVREQQLKAEHRAMLAAKLREEFMRTSTIKTTTTTTTTTTPRPMYIEAVSKEHKASKVMNAPKEYYPVGYEKNFDDNFKSKVDLPPTSFSCAKQKHFPGLYADTDLGCMVFHVCALTDDGMVRKSFLCPENTLFDQTILKCNWWFYVDCSSSTSVYDSNIPISKSYQLMKSLTYFSKYNSQKNEQGNEKDDNALDIDTLRESMEGVARRLEQAKKTELQQAQQSTTTTTSGELTVPDGAQQQQLSN